MRPENGKAPSCGNGRPIKNGFDSVKCSGTWPVQQNRTYNLEATISAYAETSIKMSKNVATNQPEDNTSVASSKNSKKSPEQLAKMQAGLAAYKLLSPAEKAKISAERAQKAEERAAKVVESLSERVKAAQEKAAKYAAMAEKAAKESEELLNKLEEATKKAETAAEKAAKASEEEKPVKVRKVVKKVAVEPA